MGEKETVGKTYVDGIKGTERQDRQIDKDGYYKDRFMVKIMVMEIPN